MKNSTKFGLLVTAVIVSCSTVSAQSLYVPNGFSASGVGASTSGNVGIGTSSPADQFEVVNGNRKIGFNSVISGVSSGGIISLSRADGIKTFWLGPTEFPTADNVVYGYGGSTELRLVSGGGASEGFGFYTNISKELAFASTRPTPVLKITGGGNVGIGTSSPNSALEVLSASAGGSITVNSGATSQYSSYGWKAGGVRKWSVYQHPSLNHTLLFMNEAGQDVLSIKQDGKVGIGTITPDAALTVKGDIHTREVKVDLAGAVGPDYVFEKDYSLTSLEDLKSYINENKHLPEIPSAKEMEENGINLKEMNLLLLKKVEELTLHLIEKSSEIDRLKKDMKTLKSRIK